MAKKGKGQNTAFRRELMGMDKPANDTAERIVRRVPASQFLAQMAAAQAVEAGMLRRMQSHADELRARGFDVTIER
jgi:hypothetical protein